MIIVLHNRRRYRYRSLPPTPPPPLRIVLIVRTIYFILCSSAWDKSVRKLIRQILVRVAHNMGLRR
jgi:hypothetical protein